MTIDLKWGLPFVLPFLLLGFVRLFWWVAGAGWTHPGDAAFSCFFMGFFGGVGVVALLYGEDIRWPLHIGVKRND